MGVGNISEIYVEKRVSSDNDETTHKNRSTDDFLTVRFDNVQETTGYERPCLDANVTYENVFNVLYGNHVVMLIAKMLYKGPNNSGKV